MKLEVNQVEETMTALREMRKRLITIEAGDDTGKISKAQKKITKAMSKLRDWKKDADSSDDKSGSRHNASSAANEMRKAQEFIEEYIHDTEDRNKEIVKMCNELGGLAGAVERAIGLID